MYKRFFYWIGAVLLALNVLIFLTRKSGFDYKNYATQKQLYSENATKARNIDFTPMDLQQARRLLADSLHIDTIQSDLKKLLILDNFLYESICSNHLFGPLTKKFSSPLALFNELKSDKNLAFQCGQAAYLQKFFCDAIGLKTRCIQNIQKPNMNLQPDSHVYNEVWLSEKKQWAISDFYQNRHLIYKEDNLLTAADLMDNSLMPDSSSFTVFYTDSGQIRQRSKHINDPYFSKAYYLAFFKEINPDIVYNWKNKFRHYLLDYSHFSIYDPLEKRSNFRHRIKQIVFFGWLIWLSIFALKRAKQTL